MLNVVKLFHKAINNCKTSISVVQNKLYLIQKVFDNYFDLDTAIHVLTPRSAGQWPTQKSYKNQFLFQKECGRPYNFCREADKVGWTNCACIIHPRTTIFDTHNLTIPIINNIKKIFE